ncbi:uncharacterized protein LOC120084618 [Benincasa hispida]|uniref:uncharacterized protein LOC120084618 n=1 Tax=Benincasa hispida TaxID=102211 RepID=UPI0019029426|nr:uncharacterized protein LOC120084618 [Benincasa hispida]
MLSTPLFFNFYPHPFAHKQGNHIEDISSYFLLEATGDSEIDSSVDLGGSVASTEFNDAESCTDDTPTICTNEFGKYEYEDEDEEEMVENDYDEVVESKAIGFTTKSNASIDSTKEFKMLNEVDKNRLFWETCLAS